MNPYQILGVDSKASSADIKTAFRKLASEHHPDKGGDADQFDEIKQAHDILMDDKRRAEYDSTGNTGKQPSVEELARQRVVQTFDSMLEQNNSSPDYDYVVRLCEHFCEVQSQISIQSKNAIKHKGRVEKLLKVTNGDLLIGVLQGKLSRYESQLSQLDMQHQVAEKCLEVIDGMNCGEEQECHPNVTIDNSAWGTLFR